MLRSSCKMLHFTFRTISKVVANIDVLEVGLENLCLRSSGPTNMAVMIEICIVTLYFNTDAKMTQNIKL